MTEIWTDRTVKFKPYPSTHHETWDGFMDDLAMHYWDRNLIKRFVEPAISSHGTTVYVSGLPWWMPQWWALRTVTKVAAASGVGGEATYLVIRLVLLRDVD